MSRLLRVAASVQTTVLLVFVFVSLSVLVGTVSAADLGNECEIQVNCPEAIITITGMEFTLQGDNVVVPGFFNISPL